MEHEFFKIKVKIEMSAKTLEMWVQKHFGFGYQIIHTFQSKRG